MRLRELFAHAGFGALVDMLIPPRPSERVVCTLALEELRGMRPDARHARRGGGSFDALLPYHDPRAMALVWEVKYYRNQRALLLAAALLSETIAEAAAESLGVPLLIPVPMHPERRRQRGHNQTELLCAAAAKRLPRQIEYSPDILRKIRHTAPQQTLPRAERLRNVEFSMQVKDPAAIADRVCIVVDDVATTGATLAEARRALTDARAGDIVCLALAA